MQSFDIPRMVTVYPDRFGVRWWTKAWFNGRDAGEESVEIDRQLAVRFMTDNVAKDEWLEEYNPKQMAACHNAVRQTRDQLLKALER